MSQSPSRQQRIEGAIYGLAYGDAWGYPQEFKSWQEIKKAPQDTLPDPAVISDDTQMSLYVIAALLADLRANDSEIAAFTRGQAHAADEIRVKVAEHLLHWLHDPDNNRAPGNTCLSSLRKLERVRMLTGLEGTSEWSKGNGANIRCPWLGLLPESVPNGVVAALGAIQSSTTHNEPDALGSAALTSLIVRGLLNGDARPGAIWNYAIAQAERLRHDPISHLLPTEYLLGLERTQIFLEKLRDAHTAFVTSGDDSGDICVSFGEGWVAEEALACAIALADRYAQVTPTQALYRAANSSGDSDSIGAITGAFVGAAAGSQAFPPAWRELLEPRYAADLADTLELLSV